MPSPTDYTVSYCPYRLLLTTPSPTDCKTKTSTLAPQVSRVFRTDRLRRRDCPPGGALGTLRRAAHDVPFTAPCGSAWHHEL
eukprot:796309-Pyramimonas_sp.AAC.1